MGRLTAEHTAFLRKHGFSKPRDWALNATGMTRTQYREALHQERKIFVYGVAPCPRGQHTLRTAGGCPQCNTSYIGYAKTSRLAGYVYILKSGRLTKVGFSRDAPNRVYIANIERYGNQKWRIRSWLYSSNAGQLEIAAHRALGHYIAIQFWERNGESTYTREVFRCSYDAARQALLSALTFEEASDLQEFK